MEFANSISYSTYSQSLIIHHHVMNAINVYLGGEICRTSQTLVIFKTLRFTPKF